MKDAIFNVLQRFVEFCIRRRIWVVAILGVATATMGVAAFHVSIKTDLDDLLPRTHAYIQVHERFKQSFGGSNIVSIMLEVKDGDIFNPKTLAKIQKVTQDLQRVDGANQFQIMSLASKKAKDIRGSTDGIEFVPLMWPDIPQSDRDVATLRKSVMNNPLVYGAYVSRDLKAALITVDFYDQLVNYETVFQQINAIADSVRGDGVVVRVTGAPILFGWVNHYLPETLLIFLLTVGMLILLLFVTARTWRGTVLPLLAGVVSATWALGAATLLGFNVDPLVIVVAFLITARSISHSVQLVTRFDDEIVSGADNAKAAARASMLALFKPGMLGVVADAGCMIVVLLTPIALMQKVAIIGTVWVLTIALSAVVLTPVLLSWIKNPKSYAHPFDVSPILQKILDVCIRIVTSKWRYTVLAGATIVFIGSGIYAFNLTVGDANPGSPILWQKSIYNTDAEAINREFPGADRMFVVFAGNQPGAMKDPNVLRNMSDFQKFMGAQPEVGASLSLADVIPVVNRTLHESNPRYLTFGKNKEENAELAYMLQSGSEPGDMDRLVDPKYQNGSVTLFFHDHQGSTIRTAIARIKEFMRSHHIEQGEFKLAGGMVGVLAAINEVLLSGQVESIAFALLVLVACCAVAYRSMMAGIFFMVPVVLANTLTFTFMALKGIGMNINTVPVAALGIGLGVDYAFYIVDGIKEDLHHHGHNDLVRAITRSINTAGRGVLITASTLIISVVLWSFSSLRFQAEMATLMAIWLAISAGSALFIMPAMVYVFRPKFVIGGISKTRRGDDARKSGCMDGKGTGCDGVPTNN
ncbi:efflux RND transporter permease subunit [Burkholderia sp. Bp9142]|uniref:efflux RND transporter permease subunit n=1 Tax=Burkholderia sp. Bp9142 TaxID=2184573 RepID=UPI000F5A906C|nr:MMPL family transporter [Burkholderia sp. Bp9142]RQR27562.1 RND transporter [Burkholderia sp. Bp9142]